MTLDLNLSNYARITMTNFIKKSEIKNEWVLINAENAVSRLEPKSKQSAPLRPAIFVS